MPGVLRALVAGLLGLAFTPACGPATYLSRVTFGASGEVAQARVSNGERMAPYEYVAATEYLRQAKELAGYARFQDSNRFAARARDMAHKAKDVARSREKNDELPEFIPDGSMYITSKGAVKKGKLGDPLQAGDSEKPPLGDDEKPPLGDQPAQKGGGR